MKKAVFSGTFDPLTSGHMDIIERAARIFDEVTVAILNNPDKSPLFSLEERVNMIEEAVRAYPNVKVDTFEGFVVEYCEAHDIGVVIRGLRNAADLEYESLMAHTNRKLSHGKVDTYFLLSGLEHSIVSSSALKQIAQFHGDLAGYAPQNILDIVYKKYGYKRED